MNINQSSTLNRSFTNTITGNFTIGKQKIANSLGITIGQSKSYGTSYVATLNPGERKTIIYRPKIRTHKIVSTYYRYPVNTTGNRVAIKSETSYVDSFVDWDYDWRYGY